LSVNARCDFSITHAFYGPVGSCRHHPGVWHDRTLMKLLLDLVDRGVRCEHPAGSCRVKMLSHRAVWISHAHTMFRAVHPDGRSTHIGDIDRIEMVVNDEGAVH